MRLLTFLFVIVASSGIFAQNMQDPNLALNKGGASEMEAYPDPYAAKKNQATAGEDCCRRDPSRMDAPTAAKYGSQNGDDSVDAEGRR